MRIRSIKPEFWTSKTISQVSWDARLVLKGLESYVDDNGVGVFDLELIVAEIFPRDHFRNPPEVSLRVSEAIKELLEAGFLWVYEAEHVAAGDGRTITAVYIANWERLQRINKPNKGRYRRPDGTLEFDESEIREHSGSIPEDFWRVPEHSGAGTEEQRNRGTEEQSSMCISADAKNAPRENTKQLEAEFEKFWDTYALKKGKGAALTAFKKARRAATLEELLTGAEREAQWRQRNPHRGHKFAQGWLNEKRWLDEPETDTGGQYERRDGFQMIADAGREIEQAFNTQQEIERGPSW